MRRTPPRTAKAKAQLAARHQCVLDVYGRDRFCQGADIPGHRCEGRFHVHEVLPRGRGGDPTDPDNCILLCRAAHEWVHAHPNAAVTLGLLRHSWDA